MTPDDLRALAARVLGEEPSDELRNVVLVALGWKMDIEPLAAGLLPLMQSPAGHVTSLPPNPLTSHDAAFGAMPAGWMLVISTAPGKNCTVDAAWDYGDGPEPDPENWRTAHAEAPDIPRAVTAAGLLARAAEMEQGGDHG